MGSRGVCCTAAAGLPQPPNRFENPPPSEEAGAVAGFGASGNDDPPPVPSPESEFNSRSKLSNSRRSTLTELEPLRCLLFINKSMPGPKDDDDDVGSELRNGASNPERFRDTGSKSFNPISITSIFEYKILVILIFKCLMQRKVYRHVL